METALFWIAWGIISFWALKTFYFSFSREKLERLRKTALGLNIAILVLTLLPWLPSELGAKTGLNLALDGNVLSILFVILLLSSAILFLTKDAMLLRLASIVTIVNTFILFVLMYALRSGTFTLTLFDIAPIIAVLFLLIGDVVGLLLWQQLQLKKKNQKNKPFKLKNIITISFIAVFLILGLTPLMSQKESEQNPLNLVSQLSEVEKFKSDVEENGRSKFGITIDHRKGEFTIIKVFESFPDHITTFNWYRVDNKTGKVYRQNLATDTWEEVGN